MSDDFPAWTPKDFAKPGDLAPRRPRGADIEIIDRHGGDSPVLTPTAVRINGVEIPIPSDSTIKIGDMSDGEAVTVTLTLFARRVTIAAEGET